VREATMRTRLYSTVIQRWGELYLLFGLGFILFVLPQREIVDFQEILDFLLILLFTIGPMLGLISFTFAFHEMRVAMKQLEALGVQLPRVPEEPQATEDTQISKVGTKFSLTLENIAYIYHHSEWNEEFTLGPLSFTMTDSQITFITGGNGSGKSTLAKLLCGLYTPQSGQIVFNGELIDEKNREVYRQLFSVIFFDFYLFDTLLGLENNNHDQRANQYLQRLRLDHKVTVENGEYSSINLSQGQRKRMALLQAYLEDRPIYVFDEWAADQDANFKAIFYNELLPDLKRQGKTVVVITHDTSYFQVADQIIELIDGKQTASDVVPHLNGNSAAKTKQELWPATN
jgi:putative ATP-binding cassette transporter